MARVIVGATFTGAAVHGDLLDLVQVGDSRGYLLRKDQIRLATKDQSDTSIPWRDLLDLLTKQDVISRSGSTLLERGSRFDELRKAYPVCNSKLIQLIHKAAATLRDFQNPEKVTSTDGQKAVSEFNEDKQTL